VWLALAIGLILLLFFYENGPRKYHINMQWGAYSASFLLAFASLRLLIREYRDERVSWRGLRALPWRLQVVGGLFLLHVLAGLRALATLALYT
jgi:hypothetical protein